MKRILFLALSALALVAIVVAPAMAQNPNKLAHPSGNFSVGSFPLWNTTLDTVAGSTGVDTFRCNLAKGWNTSYTNDLNSVTFQWDITKISGRIDSFTVKVWASADNGIGYVLLSTLTSSNATGYYSYIINSGVGNAYTNYMVTAALTNAALTSKGSWKCFVLLR